MYYHKSGLPEESEIVMCTVTNVQHHSVFAKMEEYGITGMIHISEISPGRIRNIRDYVKEGKVIVCKVLRVHQDRGHVDLSLRRVSEGQRREKANQLKFEQKAEKIADAVAKQLKKKGEEFYKSFAPKVLEDYEYLYLLFDEVVSGVLTNYYYQRMMAA